LFFRWSPGEHAGGRVDTCPFRHLTRSTIRQAVTKLSAFHVRSGRREAHLHAFVRAAIPDRVKHWRVVHARHCDGHSRGVAVAGAVVHAEGEAVRPDVIQGRGVSHVWCRPAQGSMRGLTDNFPGQRTGVQVHRAQRDGHSCVFCGADALGLRDWNVIEQNIY